MSRDRNLKKLKSNLQDTQHILDDLLNETATEVNSRWNTTRTEAARRLNDLSARLQKTYNETRSQLQSTLNDRSKQWESDGKRLKADATKSYNKNRKRLEASAATTRADLEKKSKEARAKAEVKGDEIKTRTVGLLEGVATGVLSARNKLDPKHRKLVRGEKERYPVGPSGYFKRFMALAVVIIAKRKKLINLGYQLYNKLKDEGVRESLKSEGRQQLNTMQRLIKAYSRGEYREFPYTSLVKIVAAIVYFVSVADLIPDFIPVIGYTDDLAVLAWVYSSVKDDLQMFTDWEEINEKRRKRIEKQRAEAAKQTESSAAGSTPASSSAPVADRNPGTGSEATRGSSAKESERTGSSNSPSSANAPKNTSGSGNSGNA